MSDSIREKNAKHPAYGRLRCRALRSNMAKEPSQRPHKSARQIKAENNRRFAIMVVLTLVLGGSLVIALVYGPAALLTAIPVLLLGAGLIGLPYLVLVGLEKILKRYDR